MLARVMVIAGLMLLPTAVLADEAARLRALLVEYRCPVVDRLEQIYNAFGGARPRHPFLVVSIGGCPQDYVQCLFNTRTEMLCEAASGFFKTKPDEPRAYRLPAGLDRSARQARILDRRLAREFSDFVRRAGAAGFEPRRRPHPERVA